VSGGWVRMKVAPFLQGEACLVAGQHNLAAATTRRMQMSNAPNPVPPSDTRSVPSPQSPGPESCCSTSTQATCCVPKDKPGLFGTPPGQPATGGRCRCQ
jgi:hypothetical protein